MVRKRMTGRTTEMTKSKKQENLEQQVGELTQDLQRVRADFENYRKRVETEREQARESGKVQMIFKLLPVIDNIERAINYTPKELKGNSWVEGITKMAQELSKKLTELELEKIIIEVGKTEFDPELHEAISMDDGQGEKEIISEELQSGWKHAGQVIRHSMVRVARQ